MFYIHDCQLKTGSEDILGAAIFQHVFINHAVGYLVALYCGLYLLFVTDLLIAYMALL